MTTELDAKMQMLTDMLEEIYCEMIDNCGTGPIDAHDIVDCAINGDYCEDNEAAELGFGYPAMLKAARALPYNNIA